MRKEYYIFLVLIIAAAVITGSTIGFASNFDLIMKNGLIPVEQQIQTEQTQSGQGQTEQQLTKNVQIANLDQPNDTRTEATLMPISSKGGNSTYFKEDLVISPHDQQQIIGLLVVLGMINADNYDNFLEEFQLQHELNPSGNLDTNTLNHIIKQVRTEKANRQ